MPNTKQAEKRMRRDAKRRLRNRYHLSRMKTYVRNFKNEASRRCSRVQKLLNQALAKVQGSNQ
jgi:small subunit ribosomal protein S20